MLQASAFSCRTTARVSGVTHTTSSRYASRHTYPAAHELGPYEPFASAAMGQRRSRGLCARALQV